MESQDPYNPFGELDLESELEANWTETVALHTSTLNAELNQERTTLMLKFPGGNTQILGRGDIEALTRFLNDEAKVAPLEVPDDSFLSDIAKNIRERRVDL
jgi:hypothetical protein